MNSLLNVAGTIFLIIIAINVVAFITFYLKRKRPVKQPVLTQRMWDAERGELRRLAVLARIHQSTRFSNTELLNAVKLYINVFNTSVVMCNSVDKNIQSNLRITGYDLIDKGNTIEILITPNSNEVNPMAITLNKCHAGNFIKFITDHITAIEDSVKKYTGRI
ncbi:hypothetical protein ABN214_14835 [Proteus terrae]|uniref:hypothetical protein n=1 Tax=Proteus terrae TaxID=1574161 RepID=UPI0032DBB8CB